MDTKLSCSTLEESLGWEGDGGTGDFPYFLLKMDVLQWSNPICYHIFLEDGVNSYLKKNEVT